MFETEWYLLLPAGPEEAGLPLKCNIEGSRIISCWFRSRRTGLRKARQRIPQGAVVSLDA